MVDICQKHAQENDLAFSTDPDPNLSKTVLMAFNCPDKNTLANVYLNGDPLPWKSTAKHIGCTLKDDGSMDQDVKVKRATFINDCMSLNNEFFFLKPEDQFRLLVLYNAHFSGSSSWKFSSNPVQQLFNSWHVNTKVIFDLPFGTRLFLADGLANGINAKKMVYSRYSKFLKSVANNRRPALRGLLNSVVNDVQSVAGGNIRTILLETNVLIVPGITLPTAFKNYCAHETPQGQEWKLPLLVSLLELRENRWQVSFDEETMNVSEDEITTMIENICVGE